MKTIAGRGNIPSGKGSGATYPQKKGYVVLPEDLMRVDIEDGEGNSFALIVNRNPGLYEQHQIQYRPYSEIAQVLNRFLRGRGTLIDLGANIGTVTLPVALAGSHVIAVEMLPNNCLKLSFASLVNEFINIRIIQAAVTSSDKLINYSGEEAWALVSSVNTASEAVGYRLDTILAMLRLTEPNFLEEPFAVKIDIEGHEFHSLIGAELFFEQHRPIVVFESIEFQHLGQNQHSKTCKIFFEQQNYKLFLIRANILIPRKSADFQEGQVSDFLAVPAELLSLMSSFWHDYEIRELSLKERVTWVAQMAAETVPSRRIHAVQIITELHLIDPTCTEITKHIVQALLADKDKQVQTMAIELLKMP